MAKIDLDKEELSEIWTALSRLQTKLNMDINEARKTLEMTKDDWWRKWIAEVTPRIIRLSELRDKIHERIIAIETGRAEEHVK